MTFRPVKGKKVNAIALRSRGFTVYLQGFFPGRASPGDIGGVSRRTGNHMWSRQITTGLDVRPNQILPNQKAQNPSDWNSDRFARYITTELQ